MLEALGIQKNEALYVKKKDTGVLINHIHKTKTAKKGPVSIIIMEITKTSIRFWSFFSESFISEIFVIQSG